MTEPFKTFINVALIRSMGTHLSGAWSGFDASGFVKDASHGLDDLELKERSRQITQALGKHLPHDFVQACDVILASLASATSDTEGLDKIDHDQGIAGWAILSLADYVADHGQAHFDLSLNVLKELTKRFSSEFAIRPFLLADPGRAVATLETWLTDGSPHVRRLVSEGTRPRLPWGQRLGMFVDDPAPVIGLLEALKDDPEEYVRRSVANNLNDIAKDHPDVVAKIARRWLKGASKNRQRLVRHACRTLIKQGHKSTLSALGYKAPEVKVPSLIIETPRVTLGLALDFTVHLKSTAETDQALVIDYAVHHLKANGRTQAKVFKWKTLTLKAKTTHKASRKHPMRKITTRVYYPGRHLLDIRVNGEVLASKAFELVLTDA